MASRISPIWLLLGVLGFVIKLPTEVWCKGLDVYQTIFIVLPHLGEKGILLLEVVHKSVVLLVTKILKYLDLCNNKRNDFQLLSVYNSCNSFIKRQRDFHHFLHRTMNHFHIGKYKVTSFY